MALPIGPIIEGTIVALTVADMMFGDDPDLSKDQRKALAQQREQYRKSVLALFLRKVASLSPTVAQRLMISDIFKQNFLDIEEFWMEDAADLSTDNIPRAVKDRVVSMLPTKGRDVVTEPVIDNTATGPHKEPVQVEVSDKLVQQQLQSDIRK
jgi:hypothetical protein